MILDCNLIAYDFMSDFNGPTRHFPNEFYPSGLHEQDKTVYRFGPESSKYPTLTLPCNLQDEWGNVIPNGFYMIVLSTDKKYIEFYQSNLLKAKVKVVKLVEQMLTKEELDKEAELINKVNTYKIKKKLKKYRKAQEELQAYREKREAESYAVIEDSGKGYYILRYNHEGKEATGIIQR